MNERDRELLQLVLSGDVPRHSPEIERTLAKRPDLARRLDELEAVGKGLEALADDEGEAIERARAETDERDRRAVAEALLRARDRGRLATEHRAGHRVPRLVVLSAIAATILVIVLTAVLDRNEPRTFLSGNRVRIVHPDSGVESWDEVRWEGGSAGATFVVTLEGVSTTDPVQRVTVASGRITEHRWKPNAEQLAGLPERVRISVSVLDASGDVQSSTSSLVSRSR